MLAHNIKRMARLSEDYIRRTFRLHDSETRLAAQSQQFWSRPIDESNALWWHARDSAVFDGDKWQAMGRRHTRLFEDYARVEQMTLPVQNIVDWGCGGGANAVAFAQHCRALWGVDVSNDALAECGRQMTAQAPACAFHAVGITVPDPEAGLKQIPNGKIDLFACFYVFELLPSAEHGARVLRIARQLLRPGGAALIQIKYKTDCWTTRSRRWAYARSAANMTRYRVEAFWELLESCGLAPKSVTLVPQPAEVPDTRYAYFLAQKPATGGDFTSP